MSKQPDRPTDIDSADDLHMTNIANMTNVVSATDDDVQGHEMTNIVSVEDDGDERRRPRVTGIQN